LLLFRKELQTKKQLRIYRLMSPQESEGKVRRKLSTKIKMSVYIKSDEFREKILGMIMSLEEQHNKAQQAWRDAAVQMNVLQTEYTRAENEWKMAQQRKEALMDLLGLIDEYEQK